MTVQDEGVGAVHQIGEVAELVGLSLRTIRHYEEVGLVPPSGRSAGGFRLYTDADIDRLTLVKHMKPLELTLEEMRDLLDVRDRLAQNPGAAETEALRARLAAFAATADERCERLRAKLAQATELAALLRTEAFPPAEPRAATRTR